MNAEEFYSINDPQFLEAGFTRSDDPDFFYAKRLVSEEQIEEDGICDEEIPELLYGNNGINRGFCIYPGFGGFIWLTADTPQKAVEFAKGITAYEPA